MSRDNKLSADSSQDKYDVILLDYGRNKVATISIIMQCGMRPGISLAFILKLVENAPSCIAIGVDYETAQKYKSYLEDWDAIIEIRPTGGCDSGKYYTGLEAVN